MTSCTSIEVVAVDIRDRVLLAVRGTLLEGEVQLFERDLDRLGAHGGRVHDELRRGREAHEQALQVGGRSNGHVGRELPSAGVPAAENVHAGLRLEGLLQRIGGLPGEELVHVLAVVEDEGSVDRGHRLVHRAQRRRALDVHVDVAGDHRLDPIGIGAELAAAEDLDADADIGRLDLVADHVGAAVDLRLALVIAVGQGELELRGGRGFGCRRRLLGLGARRFR